jgi:TolB protein
MVTGKASPKRGAVSDWGHQISDGLLRALTGNKGFFTTKITYCKDRVKNKTDICISDYDGSNEKVVRSLDTLAIAPRWNADSHKPLILYSEYTATNVRLVVSDLKGNAQVATSFDGLNMLPAFSKNGKQVIMCLSTEGSSQLYKYSYNARKKKTSYIALTNNDGNNISPTVLDDGDIVFCSDFETKRPQIYRMNKKGKNLTRLTDGGFCTSPVYSSEKNKIAYVKIVKGRGQIMTYNFDTEEHKQITSDALHKEECSWSSCGNYIMFSTDNGKSKRLAVYNILTNKRTFLGSGTSDKTYPAWSAYPVYSIS